MLGCGVGEGESVVFATLFIVIDGESGLDDIFYFDCTFSGVGATVVGSCGECYGVDSWVVVGVCWVCVGRGGCVTEVPDIGYGTGGDGSEVIEYEFIVSETLSGVIDGEVDGGFRVDGDVDF